MADRPRVNEAGVNILREFMVNRLEIANLTSAKKLLLKKQRAITEKLIPVVQRTENGKIRINFTEGNLTGALKKCEITRQQPLKLPFIKDVLTNYGIDNATTDRIMTTLSKERASKKTVEIRFYEDKKTKDTLPVTDLSPPASMASLKRKQPSPKSPRTTSQTPSGLKRLK